MYILCYWYLFKILEWQRADDDERLSYIGKKMHHCKSRYIVVHCMYPNFVIFAWGFTPSSVCGRCVSVGAGRYGKRIYKLITGSVQSYVARIAGWVTETLNVCCLLLTITER